MIAFFIRAFRLLETTCILQTARSVNGKDTIMHTLPNSFLLGFKIGHLLCHFNHPLVFFPYKEKNILQFCKICFEIYNFSLSCCPYLFWTEYSFLMLDLFLRLELGRLNLRKTMLNIIPKLIRTNIRATYHNPFPHKIAAKPKTMLIE